MVAVTFSHAQVTTESDRSTSDKQIAPSSENSTSSDKVNTGSRSISNNSGKVIDYNPGTDITIDDGNGAAPVHFAVSAKAKVIGPGGGLLPPNDVKKNALVRLHFAQEGGKPVVDQIKLQEDM